MFKQAEDDDEYDRHPSLHRTIARRTTFTTYRTSFTIINPTRATQSSARLESPVGSVDPLSIRRPRASLVIIIIVVTTKPSYRKPTTARTTDTNDQKKPHLQLQTSPKEGRERTGQTGRDTLFDPSRPVKTTSSNHVSKTSPRRANEFIPHPGGVQSKPHANRGFFLNTHTSPWVISRVITRQASV